MNYKQATTEKNITKVISRKDDNDGEVKSMLFIVLAIMMGLYMMFNFFNYCSSEKINSYSSEKNNQEKVQHNNHDSINISPYELINHE